MQKWDDKYYHSLNYEMKKIFGEKAIKLSINGGFTCPNRDGKIDTKGCIFCSDFGSGEFAGNTCKSIEDQLNEQKDFLSKKWKSNTYIAYFQSFTNTYDSIENLREKYTQAIKPDYVKGLAIATRPDCIDEKVVDLLSEFDKKTFLWIELGFQTSNEDTGKLIRRGYDNASYSRAINLLNKAGIRVVTHLIFGLPNENKEDMIKSVDFVVKHKPWGLKIHLLHILNHTDLYEYYKQHPFHILSQDEYTDLVCEALERVPSQVVIHRVTGDGKRSELITPEWSLHKLQVLNSINKKLKERKTYQGISHII